MDSPACIKNFSPAHRASSSPKHKNTRRAFSHDGCFPLTNYFFSDAVLYRNITSSTYTSLSLPLEYRASPSPFQTTVLIFERDSEAVTHAPLFASFCTPFFPAFRFSFLQKHLQRHILSPRFHMFLQPFYLSLDLLDEFPLRRFALYKVQKPLNVKISVVVIPAGTQKIPSWYRRPSPAFALLCRCGERCIFLYFSELVPF